MDLVDKTFDVKLGMNEQGRSGVRSVWWVRRVDGGKLSYELEDMMDVYGELKVGMEGYGLDGDRDEDRGGELGCMVG